MDSKKEQLKDSPCICLNVRRVGRLLSQMYDRHFREIGIRSTQYSLLRCVEALPEPSISGLGRFLLMDQTTVTRNIMNLEKAGLVKTQAHPADPRKKLVSLSAAGKAKLVEALPLWLKAQEHMQAEMSEAELKELSRLLGKLAKTAKQ